ncbi:MAG: hypothetical protein HYZ63_02730 [Candidatus Andersenbacteria bacterium]|nr:hypothetical protein [Candidatus Andersenbacteria bacterium]
MQFTHLFRPLHRNHLISLVLVVVAALLLLAVAWHWPLGVEERLVVRVEHIYRELILDEGEVLEQAFKSKNDAYRGAEVYSTAPFLDGRKLEAALLDKDGRILAVSRQPQESYLPGDDTLVLRFSWPLAKGLHGASLKVRLTLLDGKPLPMKVSSRSYDAYTSGGLKRNGDTIARDMGLTMLLPAPLPSAARLGVAAGTATFLISLFVWLLAQVRHQWMLAGLGLVLVIPLALGGFWFSQDSLGIADWDYYFSLHENYRKIAADYHQIPFWNPYTCGGTAGLADPEFPGIAPQFPLELLFGVPAGLKVTIWLTVAMTGLGMMALSRALRLSPLAGFLVGIAAAFSSVSLLEIVEGHVNVFAAMWIPWVFWAWLKAYQQPGQKSMWTVGCAVFLALTFYAGGIYLLMYTGLAFLFLIVLTPHHRRALAVTAGAGAIALGLAAMKLIPVLLWLRQFPDDAYSSSTVTLPWLYDILLGRHLHGAYILFRQDSGWHEYGAYIGLPVLALALIGIAAGWRRRMVASLLVATVAALLLSSTGPGIAPIFDVMWFFPRSNISRFILFAVLPITLLAGFGFERLRKVWRGPVVCVVIGLVAIDLMSLTYQLSSQSFVLPHIQPPLPAAPAPIAFTSQRFDDEGQGSRKTRTYDATLAGYGTTAYCSVLGPKPSVGLVSDEDGGLYLNTRSKTATSELVFWSPNRVVARLKTAEETEFSLNTNYVDGWMVNIATGDSSVKMPAQERAGRVAVTLPSGEHEVEFTYRAPGFAAGVGLTLLTITSLFFVWRWRGRM